MGVIEILLPGLVTAAVVAFVLNRQRARLRVSTWEIAIVAIAAAVIMITLVGVATGLAS